MGGRKCIRKYPCRARRLGCGSKTIGFNTAAISEAVKMKRVRKKLPQDIRIDVAKGSSAFIKESILSCLFAYANAGSAFLRLEVFPGNENKRLFVRFERWDKKAQAFYEQLIQWALQWAYSSIHGYCRFWKGILTVS